MSLDTTVKLQKQVWAKLCSQEIQSANRKFCKLKLVRKFAKKRENFTHCMALSRVHNIIIMYSWYYSLATILPRITVGLV